MNKRLRIAILTSSRADYGIYLPLLKAFQAVPFIDFGILVFGSHVSYKHGYTAQAVKEDGFPIWNEFENVISDDTPHGISKAYAKTVEQFSDYWRIVQERTDLVIALGDRFEMAAAVASLIPFGIKLAHLHCGETTLGAIDNIYRHSITLASQIHFVSHSRFKDRIIQLMNDENADIYNVGSLSLENLEQLQLLPKDTFQERWNIDLNLPTILITVHPETVNYRENQIFCRELYDAVKILVEKFQIVITMPNADTSGLIYRNTFLQLAEEYSNIFCIENFGTQSYFSCMKHVKLLVGNTSSGIIEAASFNKYVLNLGNRQKARMCGENVIHLPFLAKEIVENAIKYSELTYTGINPYYQPEPSAKIVKCIRNYFESI